MFCYLFISSIGRFNYFWCTHGDRSRETGSKEGAQKVRRPPGHHYDDDDDYDDYGDNGAAGGSNKMMISGTLFCVGCRRAAPAASLLFWVARSLSLSSSHVRHTTLYTLTRGILCTGCNRSPGNQRRRREASIHGWKMSGWLDAGKLRLPRRCRTTSNSICNS